MKKALYITKSGIAFNCDCIEVDGREVWMADDFIYYAETFEELASKLDYFTQTWNAQGRC